MSNHKCSYDDGVCSQCQKGSNDKLIEKIKDETTEGGLRYSITDTRAKNIIKLVQNDVVARIYDMFETREQHPDENYADGFYWAIQAINQKKGGEMIDKLTRVECKGVGDNDGFFEIGGK